MYRRHYRSCRNEEDIPGYIDDSKAKYQFSKWQWVEVETYPNTQDIRKESRKIYFDRINLHNVINTKNKWKERMSWAGGIPQIDRLKKENRE